MSWSSWRDGSLSFRNQIFFCFWQTPSCMMHVNMSNREEEEEEEMEERERGGKNILLVKYSQGIEESAKTDNTPMKTARLSPLHNICCIRDGGLAQPDSCAAPTREEVAAVGGASLGEEADMDFSPGFCCCCCAIKPFQNPKPTQKHTHSLSLSLKTTNATPRSTDPAKEKRNFSLQKTEGRGCSRAQNPSNKTTIKQALYTAEEEFKP